MIFKHCGKPSYLWNSKIVVIRLKVGRRRNNWRSWRTWIILATAWVDKCGFKSVIGRHDRIHTWIRLGMMRLWRRRILIHWTLLRPHGSNGTAWRIQSRHVGRNGHGAYGVPILETRHKIFLFDLVAWRELEDACIHLSIHSISRGRR